jgi:hypothetical protein
VVTVPAILAYCPVHPVFGAPHRGPLELTMLLYGVLIFTLITRSALQGRWLFAMIFVWLASAVPLAVLATFVEQRTLRPLVFNSWALTFGDPFILPALFALLALAWKRLTDEDVWYRRKWFPVNRAIRTATCIINKARPNAEPI